MKYPVVISDRHFLSGALVDSLPSPRPMEIRRLLIIHFTAGATGKSSIEYMRENGLSAHVVIDRNGGVTQCVAFDHVASHAGGPGKSRWIDPNTGKHYDGLNGCAIGIELANAGNDGDAMMWARHQPGFESVKAKHRKGGQVQEWEAFPAAQYDACQAIAIALVRRYQLDDVTGHDCVCPERKDDPGPAFPMERLRKACGFEGLPVIHSL